MMNTVSRSYSLLIVSLAIAPAAAEVPQTLLTSPLAVTFGSAPAIEAPKLSPYGDQMIYLEQAPSGFDRLRIVDFAAGTVGVLLEEEGAEFEVAQCNWANPDHILCAVMEPMVSRGVRLLGAHMLLPADGSMARQMRLPCWDAVNWLPEDPDHIMIICGSSVRRVSLTTREVRSVQGGRGRVTNLIPDGRGFARLGNRRLPGDLEVWYAFDDRMEDWVPFHESNVLEIEDPFRPVGFGADPDDVYHLAWDSGTWSLFSLDLGEEFSDRLVFTHPVVDIKSVDRMGVFGRVVAAAYLDGRPRRHIIDDRVAAVHARVAGVLEGQEITIVDESWDQSTYLALARKPGRAGDYYRVDTRTGLVELIGPKHPRLAEVDLADTRSFAVTAPDGGWFGAHLTLPKSGELPAPTIVLPRSFAIDLDLADPNYLVEFLAASGYAVLRVDHRGSDEFGASWLPSKVVVGWRRAVADVTTAIDQLVAAGTSDPERICAIGIDVGAFTSLMAAFEDPQLFRCLVTIAGARIGRNRSTHLGALASIEASPVRRAQDLEPPSLLIDVWRSEQSVALENVLADNDKDVELIEYAYGRDDFSRAPNRIDMLVRIANFLDQKLR